MESEDFVRVSSLNELRRLEPGSRVKISYTIPQILCFRNSEFDNGFGFFYAFILEQNDSERIYRAGWYDKNLRFDQTWIIDFNDFPYQSTVTRHDAEYYSDLSLLRKARLTVF